MGPLEASSRSRLPSWGSGLFELSTYSAAVSLYAFVPPLVPVQSLTPTRTLLPVLALQRPFLAGEGWRSGFYIAPQLGWRALGSIYAVTQLQQRLLPALPVTVETVMGEAWMFCEPPAPRWMPLRFAGVFTGL
ncbi:MAG: hypothetical protein LAP38_08970 [Acidobacteriia bacterium]|nr:hypothetical protein [Terriglobia bacterium]